MPKTVKVNTKRRESVYSVEITSGGLNYVGEWAKATIGNGRKLSIVSNRKVFRFYGERVLRSFKRAGFDTNLYLIGDGEQHKNLKTLSGLLDSLSKSQVSRGDVVVGLGGGVVGDIAGFAASIHLRGVDFLQIPTTLLSMIDSSVGGKTGINTEFGKNLVGTFYQPKGVLIDPNVLVSLPNRELTAGLCECIKQGAVAGNQLFSSTVSILTAIESKNFAKLFKTKDFTADFESFLAAQIAFKAKIVAGDELESIARNDAKSRKILNFGHTFAHALERATDYRYLKHGEAVGYGVVFAAELSKKLGLLDTKSVNLLRDVVCRAGELPPIGKIDPKAVFRALKYDKKNVNASIRWVLLERIGKPIIVPHEKIGDKLVRQTINEFISANRLPN